MLYHHIRRHRYTIAVGFPVAVLLASALSLGRNAHEVCVVPEDNRFVELGETVTLDVTAQSDEPTNVIGGVVRIPIDMLTVERTSKDGSVIDLWSEEPFMESPERLRFSGGIVSDTGFTGTGHVFSFIVTPVATGTAEVVFDEVHMLAHDGTGNEVTCGANPITLSIREPELPSPDVNDDNSVNIFDLGLVSSRLFWGYEARYDLNMDGRITMADLGILFDTFRSGDRLASLAMLWFR